MKLPKEPTFPPLPQLLQEAQVLDAVPVPNQSAQVEERGKESVVIYIPLRARWFMNPPWSWLLRVRRRAGYELQGLGREVWEACDGRRTVEMIIDGFATRHHLRFHEARLSVMAFLQELVRRGIVVLVGKQPESAGGQSPRQMRRKAE